jgi:PHD/YefM family antitoxin component YafN of YafNO toxin-antitoxin module
MDRDVTCSSAGLCPTIQNLDPSVQQVGISRLRALNVTQLRELDKTLVIQDNDKPLAVLLKYEYFLAMQERISRLRTNVRQEGCAQSEFLQGRCGHMRQRKFSETNTATAKTSTRCWRHC